MQNSKSTTFAQLKFSARHIISPARVTMGATAEIQTSDLCDLWAEYNCIQVMSSCLNSSLHIHCMLNLTSADSYTPVPYSLTCANAWVICFPHVSLQNELWPSSSSSCSLCLILLWPQIRPVLTDDKYSSTGELFHAASLQPRYPQNEEGSLTQASADGTVMQHLCSEPKQQIESVLYFSEMSWTWQINCLCEWKHITEPNTSAHPAPKPFNAADASIHLWLLKE